jgi:thiamine pyrophosphate-dependent acetolactate synthase large subunit-like protein
MGTAREWPRLSRHPLDLHYVPSAMGGAVPLGLGIAMARPDREVVVMTGDGSLAMNLGCLITVAAARPANLTILLFDNGVYAGILSVAAFADLASWERGIAAALAMPGPRFVSLLVRPVRDEFSVESPGPMPERTEAFRQALLAG